MSYFGKCSKLKAREQLRLFVVRGKFRIFIIPAASQMAKKSKPKKESYTFALVIVLGIKLEIY